MNSKQQKSKEYIEREGEMNRQRRISLRVLFGACLALTLCLHGSAERGGSKRPRGGSGFSRSTTSVSSASSRSSSSRSTFDDDFLDLDVDSPNTSFLFDDDGLDGQDDIDYPDDDIDGIDFSEGDDDGDDFDEGGKGPLDDAEDDGDGHQSSSTEKGALYDAYNLLHSLAQVSFGVSFAFRPLQFQTCFGLPTHTLIHYDTFSFST